MAKGILIGQDSLAMNETVIAHVNDTTKHMTAADRSKLNGIMEGATKTVIANNLVTTTAGSALDATQGKVLNDKIVTINTNITAIPSSVRWYGKYAMMSGGSGNPVSFVTVDRDDFGTTNLVKNATRFTITRGDIHLVRFQITTGRISISGSMSSTSLWLCKNGALVSCFGTGSYGGEAYISGLSHPIPVTTGDYFYVSQSLINSGAYEAKDIIFTMEVLG